VWGKEEVYTGFWRRNRKERYNLEDPGVDGGIILNFIFWVWDGGAWIGLFWLRIGSGGGLL